MEDCLPVLGEVERLKAALDTQKRELQRLTEDSSRAQAAYTAAQNTDPMHGVQFEKLLPRLFSCHENRTEV